MVMSGGVVFVLSMFVSKLSALEVKYLLCLSNHDLYFFIEIHDCATVYQALF